MLASSRLNFSPASKLICASLKPGDESKPVEESRRLPNIPKSNGYHVIHSDPSYSSSLCWGSTQRILALPSNRDCENLVSAIQKMRKFFELYPSKKPESKKPEPEKHQDFPQSFLDENARSKRDPNPNEIWIFPDKKNYSEPSNHVDPLLDARDFSSESSVPNNRLSDFLSRVSSGFSKPTVYSEACNVLENIEHVLYASCALLSSTPASANSSEISPSINFGTTACRNHDSGHLHSGDHAIMVLAQVDCASRVYRELFTQQPVNPADALNPSLNEPESVQATLIEKFKAISAITNDAARIGHLAQGHPLANGKLKALEDFLAVHKLQTLENEIVEICKQHAKHPVCATFLQHRLGVFAGEVSVSGKAVQGLKQIPMPAESMRLRNVVREIAAIHASYPDVRTFTIKHFTHIDQIVALRELLNQYQLENIAIVANLDSTAAVDCFLMHAQFFKNKNIAVVLDRSSLQHAAGTALAIIEGYRTMACAYEHEVTISQSSGASVRRGGWGFSVNLRRQSPTQQYFARHVGRSEARRQFMQTEQADLLLGNRTLAQQFLQVQKSLNSRIDSTTVATQADLDTTKAHIDAAKEIFQPLIKAELALRNANPNSNLLARLYLAHPVIATLRGINNFVSSGQEISEIGKDASPRHQAAPAHLYAGHATQADIVAEVFGLGCAWVFQHLCDQSFASLEEMFKQARQSSKDGNPVVREIMLSLALQAASLHFSDLNHRRWKAANFPPETIRALNASNAVLQENLIKIRYSLSNNRELRLYMTEYLGLDQASSDAHSYDDIKKQLDIASQAAVEAIDAAREYLAVPFFEIYKRQRLADTCQANLTKWAVNLGGFKS